MRRTAFLIPAPGLKVLDPDTLIALPVEGAQVALDPYWDRRIADGDVTVKPAKAEKAAKPAARN